MRRSRFKFYFFLLALTTVIALASINLISDEPAFQELINPSSVASTPVLRTRLLLPSELEIRDVAESPSQHVNVSRTGDLSMSVVHVATADSHLRACSDEDLVGDLPEPNYNIHFFYYPWYANPAVDGRYLHWNHRILPHWKPEVSARYPSGQHKPPEDIGASFYPRLGPYSSRDPVTINDHMRQIRSSGAGVLSVSWYPPGDADDEGYNVDSVVPLLLDAAEKYQLKVCLHIEPYKDRNAYTLRQNIEYVIRSYGNHSAFYRWPGSDLPVYYVYDSYKVADQIWTSLLTPRGSATIRGTAIDGVFLGLAVERRHMDQLVRSGFDGFYTYFASDGFVFGSTINNWDSMAKFASEHRVIFVPSVGPGYDDTRIRPWNAASTRDRGGGAYYERSFAGAVSVRPPIISITSFNEWGEGTQIEEAVPMKTKDHKYVDYLPEQADFYLRLTRKWICLMLKQI